MGEFYLQEDYMLNEKMESLFEKAYSKVEEGILFGGNACTYANEPTERNNLTIEKVEESIKSLKESFKIPVHKSSIYPFKDSDGITYIGMIIKKVEVKNKFLNEMIERYDLDEKCIVSEDTYEYLKENHADKFKFE